MESNVYWQEPDPEPGPLTSHSMVDVVFRIRCSALPTPHTLALTTQITLHLPWISNEPATGIHALRGAREDIHSSDPESGMLYLSNRVRLILRVPAARAGSCASLSGCTLKISGESLEIGRCSTRTIQHCATLFAPRVRDSSGDELRFMQEVQDAIGRLGISAPKCLPGMNHTLRGRGGALRTRSLLLADLSPADSLRLQEEGIGPDRLLGCGLFVPHKSVAPV